MGPVNLRVELFYDDEVDQWGYAVPALSILGTGCPSRSDAERFAIDAVRDVIESAGDAEVDEGVQVMTLELQVAKAG